ncbi:MAG TPA: DNA methyltransferase [Candidatus Dormibacteraeota bacterium]|nr:DNA methyltransferase [Candidatus Dormibacteraeota bacterium]
MTTIETNLLYYGDNLDILRRYIPDESVDLVYLDPPFNSDRNYNVIFKDESGRKSDAQLLAFEDTWHWGPSAEATYAYLTETARHQGRLPDTVSTIIAALRSGIGENQMMAYLVEMAVRLVELRRVLKPTGSLYLHCDPTASHYLKVLLDAVFGPEHFRSDITWQRTNIHNDSKGWSAVADTLLYFVKDRNAHYTWVPQRLPLSDVHVAAKYRNVDAEGRPYTLSDMRSPNPRPNLMYEWKGFQPHPNGWAYSRETMERLDAEGRIWYPKTTDKRPRLIRYLDAALGTPITNVWTDIDPINSRALERLGYPTQKPVALLERIVSASSNPGDVILDPFCGCGTAVVAAQKLDRRWIGIDITYLSIAVMRARLKDTFDLDDVPVVGQPTEVEGARQLAQSPEGRYQFQWWALNLVEAQPVGGVERKGADRGIDGVITFSDERHALQTVVVSVKSGHVNSSMVRDLKGTLDRERAVIGLFVTLDEPTREMSLEASTAGLYHSDLWNRDYPKIQILSIRELLDGRHPELPPSRQAPFQKALRHRAAAGEQEQLFDRER